MNDTGGLAGLFKDMWSLLLGVCIAVFFGIVKEAKEYSQTNPTPPIKWKMLFLKAILAGASGLLVTMLTLEWKLGPYLSGVLVAVAGYAGAEFIEVIKEAAYETIRRRLGAQGPQATKGTSPTLPKDREVDEASG